MDTGVLIAVVVVVVLVVAVVVALPVIRARRRTRRLREDFGPEYERLVEERGDRRAAESELEQRQERRAELDIRPLDPSAAERYADAWRKTQSRFVDAPEQAIGEADRLVAEVMRERGYPVDDFEQRSSDVSVDHPGVASNYREAHRISLRHQHGEASTEDLRQAIVHYRSLFDELLDTRGTQPGGREAESDTRGAVPESRTGGTRTREAEPPAGGGEPRATRREARERELEARDTRDTGPEARGRDTVPEAWEAQPRDTSREDAARERSRHDGAG